MSGSSSFGSAPLKKARIEIIPLIDVIFFLLATFVLFTLSLNTTRGIKVILPQAAQTVPRDPIGTMTISMTKEGVIGWDKKQVTAPEFLTLIQTLHQTAPDTRILVNADQDAAYSQVFWYLLNEIRKAGFGKVFLETRGLIEQG